MGSVHLGRGGRVVGDLSERQTVRDTTGPPRRLGGNVTGPQVVQLGHQLARAYSDVGGADWCAVRVTNRSPSGASMLTCWQPQRIARRGTAASKSPMV